MILLLSGASRARARLKHPRLGWLLTPTNRNSTSAIVAARVPWAADNDCFSGLDRAQYLAMLAKIARAPDRSRLLFVTVPDVVADARATMQLWREWLPVVRAHGLPPAFVAQDGQTIERAPWDDLAALFVGGSTQYKEVSAAPLIVEAKRRGVWVHAGRVQTLRRVRLMDALGVDSFDGSSFSRWPDRWIPWILRHTSARQHGMLDVLCSS